MNPMKIVNASALVGWAVVLVAALIHFGTALPAPWLALTLVCELVCASEVVQIMVPPELEGEPPRHSGSLRHHTAYKPHRVLVAHHIEGQDTVVTSSTAGIAGPHYLTAWDLPTAAERADGGQHLPTISFRITAEKCPAQSALHWSSKVELLFSASEQSGQLFAWSLESQTRKFVVRLHECGVTGLLELTKLSGKTSFLVTGSKDGNMCVWDMGAFIEGRKTA